MSDTPKNNTYDLRQLELDSYIITLSRLLSRLPEQEFRKTVDRLKELEYSNYKTK